MRAHDGTSDDRSADDCSQNGTDVLDSSRAGGLLIRGGVLRFGGYAAGVALSVLSAALVTRHLGVARFGRYTTVLSIIGVVAAVTDAGMSAVGTREYAVLVSPQREDFMRDLLGLRVALTLLGVLLAAGFAIVAGYDTALVIGTAVASFGTVALVFQHTLSIPLATDLRLGLLSSLELTRSALIVVGVVLVVVLGGGVLPLLATQLLANALLIPPTARLVRGRLSARLSLRPRRWRPLARATFVFSVATSIGVLYMFTAQIVTSLVTTSHENGLFAVSFRVFIMASAACGIVVSTALPFLSRAARDDQERHAYALQRIFELSFAAGVGSALVMAAGSGFIVSVVAGPSYAPAATVLAIQSFAMIASFVLAGWVQALMSLKLHRGLLTAYSSALVVGIVVTAVLADRYGARGAAIATICGETTLAAASLAALVRHRPHYRPNLSAAIKIILAGLCAGVLSLVPNVPSLLSAVVAAVVYAAVILATGALPAEVRELIPLTGRRS